jgi:hypothetical protein
VAEGGGLLNRCTGSTRTVSSNLIPSANFLELIIMQRFAASWNAFGLTGIASRRRHLLLCHG